MPIDTPYFLLILFLIGFVASFIGNLVSGVNSLISLSMMVFLGVPPQIAVSTHAAGALGWRLGGFRQYYKAGKIAWRYVLPLSLLSCSGTLIGTHILVYMDETLLKKATSLLILCVLPILFLRRDIGVDQQQITPVKRGVGYSIYFLLCIWAGFFGAGVGILFVYAYLCFFGLSMLELKGTDRIPGFLANITAIVILYMHGVFNLHYVMAFLPGTFLGGMIGTRYAFMAGDKNLKILTLVGAVIVAITLLIR
jgi:uncharacterized membrane protein YfcA